MSNCYWCGKYCGETCLNLNKSTQMRTNDPAYWMLHSGHKSTPPSVYREGCYICEDPEFAQMGMPLCEPCPQCTKRSGTTAGHIPAEDPVCEDCGYDLQKAYEQTAARKPS
jgi:hypothetical protein